MSPNPPAVLLVEGKDDADFFKKLVDRLGLKDLVGVKSDFRRDNFRVALRGIFPDLKNEDLPYQTLGIVRDADDSATNTFKSVQTALKNLNLPVPKKPLQVAQDRIRVSIFIMPGQQSGRMLEDLCLKALENHPLKPCVDEYVACAQIAQPLRLKNVPKATLNALLSCIENDDNEVRMRLTTAVSQPWWPWDHPAFDEVKAFVRQVANVTG